MNNLKKSETLMDEKKLILNNGDKGSSVRRVLDCESPGLFKGPILKQKHSYGFSPNTNHENSTRVAIGNTKSPNAKKDESPGSY